MSADELQMIFHVDSVDLVPNYEVVQLLHHDHQQNDLEPPQNNNRPQESKDRIAEDTNPSRRESTQQYQYRHRRKRNLPPPTSNQQQSKDKDDQRFNIDDREIYRELARERFDDVNDLQNSVYDVNDIKEHRVSFHVFGENVNLTLRPTRGLFKSSIHKLPMWFVHAEANATNGLQIQKIVDEVK